MKQTLKIGITVLVVALLATSGIALATQTTDSDTDVAVEDTPAYARIQDRLGPLVEDGTITQAQADAVAGTLADGLGPHRGHRGFHVIGAVADFLDLEPDQMREALSEYATLGLIAEANGSSADELIDHLIGLCSDRLDEAVANGNLTEEEAAEKLADAEERITNMVNSEIPEPNDRPFRGRRGGPGGGGFGGPFDGAGTNA
jgi:polyhydroxyalkanoate synthesis regulator phasin